MRPSHAPEYRVGVIGDSTHERPYGHNIHLAWVGLPQVEIVALADPDAGAHALRAAECGARRTYTDHREMLAAEDLDFVSICPHYYARHAEWLLDCIAAGVKGVYIEKPMTRTLAEWLSRAVAPDWYAVVGTLIGALGSFMTGSNTNSNAVFAGLQQDSAQLMGLSVSLVLALQTASAAIASMMAPAKILVGASTVGISRGDEGRVLRSLLLYGAVLLAGMTAVAWLLLRAGY